MFGELNEIDAVILLMNERILSKRVTTGNTVY